MNKLPRGFGLVSVTVLWAALTVGVLFGFLGSDGKAARAEGERGAPRAQEPPVERTLWDRVTAAPRLLLHRNETPQHALAHALDRLGVHAWHKAGYQGQGLKIAILDSGFKGYSRAMDRVFPRQVRVRSFRKDGRLDAKESQHGILCAEVVRRLAPKAELLFANWEPENPEYFLEAVRWARREGAQLISCSLIMPSWSDGEGGGPIHARLREILGAGDRPGDMLCFISAGNTALRHWGGAFRPATDGWHQWSRARKDNGLRPLGEDRVSVELCGAPASAWELAVRDVTTGREIGRARSGGGAGTGRGAVVRFDPTAGHRYAVRVRKPAVPRAASPVQNDSFHLTVLGGRLQYATRQGSIPFPGDGAEVVTVGAVDERGRRLAYSSCGPNGRAPKPDLVAEVPFPSLWRPTQPFAGTSAAAPQAAALAALVWSRYPGRPARQVREALRGAARPLGGPGHSTETGHGLVALP
jgi:hypothetical protein